uniref:M1 family metallopeptidase n=1 Tax=Paractinoplanes polyasparticus TaxID=2856853 RepID=UPI001C85B70D|nr:M1 family metallopeptidase [Actinoplanes polyasparticus]
MRITPMRHLLVIGLVVAAAPLVAGAGTAGPGSAGIGDRLFPLLGNGGYDVGAYDLRLTYPEKDPAQTVRGDVSITATATQQLSQFNLDFAGGGPSRVDVNGKSATFVRDGDELVVTPQSYLRKGRAFTVTVHGFTAVPEDPDPNAPDGFTTTPDGTALLGQPAAAHRLFPSNDHPSDKAAYTITTNVPQGWTGTASGVLASTRSADGRVVSTYRHPQPMASELLQVVAGDFVVHERAPVGGVRVRDVVPRRLATEALPRFDVEREQISWLTGQVGPYPFDVYGSLLIDVELGAALETQTLSVYDSSIVALPRPVLESIEAHELAHHWFGNSVAPAEWSDVWLNEGHATWYELLWAEKIGAVEEHTGSPTREEFFKRVYAVSDTWRAQFGPVARPTSAAQLFDLFNSNVYYGGALALYALEQEIGTPAFQRLERAWPSVNRGRSASTDDFITLASQVAGRDLKPFLTAWLYGTTTPPMPGHPDWTTSPSARSLHVPGSLRH